MPFVEATEWNGLRGTIEDDGNTIRWDNGGAWQKRMVVEGAPDLSGDWHFNGLLTRIEQNGSSLVFTNEIGNRAEGLFISPTEVEATEWGGLRGTIEDDGNTIRWDNGGAWQKGLAPIVREVIDGVTSEDGDTGRFRVRLGMQPTANVTLFFDTSKNDRGQDEALLATGDFRKDFTPQNWDQFQDVVLDGQDDNDVDGDVAYRVLGVAFSDDPRYDLLHMADANFVNLDNDTGNPPPGGGGAGNLFLEYAVSSNSATANGTLSFQQTVGTAPAGQYRLTGDTGGLVTTFTTPIGLVQGGGPFTMIFTTEGAQGIGGSGQFNFNVSDGQVSGAGGIGFIDSTAGPLYMGGVTGGTYTPPSPLFVSPNAVPVDSFDEVGGPASLTLESLEPIAAAASDYWIDSGLQVPEGVRFEVVDLPDDMLGAATGNVIYLDQDAAGFGWFVDTTPFRNEEFSISATGQPLRAWTWSDADHRIDLLTVVSHELGHLVGLAHDHALEPSVMDDVLAPGIRSLPTSDDLLDGAAR